MTIADVNIHKAAIGLSVRMVAAYVRGNLIKRAELGELLKGVYAAALEVVAAEAASTYPMVAPNYARRRSQPAKSVNPGAAAKTKTKKRRASRRAATA